ncbi:DNA methyltransferase [Bacillus safensis]|uniref:site-specific DNA-methyltransferase n=1 Tax=Bacillus TaxID=1386 RepID=UPI0028802B41|nr:site-specific DNA-methyltransferase [Bacillus sp. SG20001]WNF52526.1 site-specific DNA-methyltransferase [Bacillus sp. SG20001]
MELIEPCVLAGCPVDGIVLDPFMGLGTTGIAALKHSRNFIGIELNPEYIKIANKRLNGVQIELLYLSHPQLL